MGMGTHGEDTGCTCEDKQACMQQGHIRINGTEQGARVLRGPNINRIENKGGDVGFKSRVARNQHVSVV
jgi:hypothetical protein